MVGRDRGQLLDYAAALAVTLSEKDGWHVEKYEPDRLETLIVDLMLNRFDAALQTVSGHRALPSRRPSGCVLFIPEAQAIPRATFQQLVRLSAGTRDHRLRLVALFPGSSQACAERISWMGGQVARWDLDDDPRGASADALFADARARAHTPTIAGKHYRHFKWEVFAMKYFPWNATQTSSSSIKDHPKSLINCHTHVEGRQIRTFR
jgi:hypothetical protein